MTSKLPTNDSSNDRQSTDAAGFDREDESQFAALLADAYSAPPVPRSLAMRLESGIAQQWGHSPEIARSHGKVAVAQTKRLAARSLWLAGAIAATVAFMIVFAGGSNRYAWAAVVEAMERSGLIQIDDAGGTRWLDLSQQVVCQKRDQETQWIDFRHRVVLTRSSDSGDLHRRRLEIAGDPIESDVLLAAFLFEQPLTAESIERFRSAKVVDQQWQTIAQQGLPVVELQVDFAMADDQRLELTLQLDPKSKLPRAIESTGSLSSISNSQSKLTLSNESLEQLQTRLLPSNATMAAADGSSNSTPSQQYAGNPAGTVDPAMEPAEPANAASGDASNDLVATLPIGASNKWKPVAVVHRSDQEVRSRIDSILDQLWKQEDIQAVDRADDLQLLRRAYLDLAGRTPSVTEVRRFMNDPSENRYPVLIDNLLESPDHASQMAAVWRSFLIPEGIDLNAFGGREAFEKWLAERFAKGDPYDQIVRQLLLAEGRLSQSGPLLFYSALKLNADELAARTSRVFLGMRLECAQCHDHPFEPWTQQDFWSYAAFFAQISRPKGQLENVSTVMRVQDVDRGEVMLPETEDVIAPRFLGESSQAGPDTEPQMPRRQRLALWLTGPDNPYFARATVNRVWSHFFGRGIVDPVDDFGVNNPPVSPELLDTLASQFIDSGFDLKTLIRSIALSQAYQLSSRSDRDNESPADVDQRLQVFGQMNVKTLTAEQLYDCIAVATLMEQPGAGNNEYTVARFGNSSREQFLQQFATPTSNRSEYLAGIPQALMLMNGSLISQATGAGSSGLIRSLEAPFFTDRQRIDVLFMATLSRPARPDELQLTQELLPVDATTDQRRHGLADLLWVLINSSEFALNH